MIQTTWSQRGGYDGYTLEIRAHIALAGAGPALAAAATRAGRQELVDICLGALPLVHQYPRVSATLFADQLLAGCEFVLRAEGADGQARIDAWIALLDGAAAIVVKRATSA